MTTADYIDAIKKRTSRRSFRAKLPDEETRQVLRELTDIINTKSDGFNMIFVDDCSAVSKTLSGKFSAIVITPFPRTAVFSFRQS